MLTPELQNEIDEKWKACWPLSQLKPIAILDLVSYLFFIKAISADQQTNPAYRQAGKTAENVPGFFLTGLKGKKEEISGDYFNDPDDNNIRSLFAADNGLTELEKAYTKHPLYGTYVKGVLLMQPTSKLLDTSLGIIKIIKDADDGTKEKIWSYLLNKGQYNDANGHAYLPEYLADLLVAIIRPSMNDIILNPTIGNGNLLVSSAKYMSKNSRDQLGNTFDSYKFKGLESDGTSLRISAMNLVLNGITKPELRSLDVFAPLNSFAGEEATVILSNLIFLPGENNMNVDAKALRDSLKKDIYYLDFILKNLREDARCAVIVPGRMLFHTGTEFVNVRKEITDNLTLDALIAIDDKDRPEFNGTSILVFSKESSAVTDKVWFYKLKHDVNATNEDVNLFKQTEDIVTHFENSGKNNESGCGFYVDADTIRTKNYNFSYGEYISFEKRQVSRTHITTIKPGGFPNLETDTINRPITILQPTSRVYAEVKTKVVRSILVKQRKLINKEAIGKLVVNVKRRIRLPQLNNLRDKKIIFIGGAFILLIGMGYLFYWGFFSDDEAKKISAARTLDSASAKTVGASSLHSIDSVVNLTNSYLATDSAHNGQKTYSVISKAYFYRSPNIGNPGLKYITDSGGGVLTSLKDENGFVFVNYINSKGRSTKGWLNKNDLEETGSGMSGNIPVETNTHVAVEKMTKDESNKKTDNLSVKYLIKTKAYFYREPDTNTRLDLYLGKPNHTRLSPIEERNGFVFVIYRNSHRKITRGWLNKKDLEVEKK